MSKLNQALLKFELEQNFAYDDFFVSKCNYFAFNQIESWPNWEKNILNIYGEKYSGKSHLSEIFKKKNKAIIIKTDEINNEFFTKIRFHENIILDNLEYVSDEKILYSIFNFAEYLPISFANPTFKAWKALDEIFNISDSSGVKIYCCPFNSE